MLHSASTICANSFQRPALAGVRGERPGGRCPTIGRLGRRSHQQSRRWLDAGYFEAMVSDLRSIIHVTQGRQAQPNAAVMDGRTREGCPRAGYDGYKRGILSGALARG